MSVNLPYKVFTTKFYNYTIDYVIINGIKMYVVSNIIQQYNKINKTDKTLAYWLRLKETRALFNTIVEEYKKTNNNDDFLIPDYNQELKNSKNDGKNKDVCKIDKNIDKTYGINIPGIIQRLDFFIDNFYKKNVYLVNAVLLHDIIC